MSGLPTHYAKLKPQYLVRCVRVRERERETGREGERVCRPSAACCRSTPSASAVIRGMSAPVVLVLLLLPLLRPCQGGMCWSANKNGRCHDLLQANISKEACCASKRVSTAWTSEDLDSGALFYWTALGGGVPNCSSCRDSCKGAVCSQGKQCVMRNGQPQCICFPECSKSQRKGPVCGTDSHTYRSHCALLKKACRKKMQLQVAYNGPCQKTCDALKCPGKKQCLLDQNLMPHCVRCSRPCPREKSKNYVCGADGISYPNFCYLRQAACQKGRAIPVAYQGKCKADATCDDVRCPKGKTCLSEPGTKKPRCTSCDINCKTKKHERSGPVCGTDNQTYSSWCSMIQESCRTGTVIETKTTGKCEDDTKVNQIEIVNPWHIMPPHLKGDDATHEPNNIPLLDQESSTKS